MVRGGSSFTHLILIHHHNPVRASVTCVSLNSLVRFTQGIQKRLTEQDVQLIFTTQPCQHSCFFKQDWRNKFALGCENLCQLFHPNCVLIGSALKLFKNQYLMKTNRCTTAERHWETVNMCHHQVLIAKLKKKQRLRVMTGKYGCYRSPASTSQHSQQRGVPTHSPSRCLCQNWVHTSAPKSHCSPPQLLQGSASHTADSTENSSKYSGKSSFLHVRLQIDSSSSS